MNKSGCLFLYKHLFKTGFLDVLQLFQLTLMKGDKGVKMSKKIADTFLFGIRCPWNPNRFHSLNINAATIPDAIDVRFQIFVDKILWPEISIIKSWINIFTMESMIRRTDDSLRTCLFQAAFKRTKMNYKIVFIDHFIVWQTGFIILQGSLRFIAPNSASALNDCKWRKFCMVLFRVFFKNFTQLTLFPSRSKCTLSAAIFHRLPNVRCKFHSRFCVFGSNFDFWLPIALKRSSSKRLTLPWFLFISLFCIFWTGKRNCVTP